MADFKQAAPQVQKVLNTDKPGLTIEWVKNNSWGKNNICGSVIGKNSRDISVQEVYQTIYYLGKLRLIFTHEFKFQKYTH